MTRLPQNYLLAKLEEVLRRIPEEQDPEGLGLMACANVTELLALGNTRRYLPRPEVEFGDHFDPEADFLIYDPQLGTLGLVYDVRKRTGELQSILERAIYVRHLLVQEASFQRQKNIPLVLEVVLLSTGANEGALHGALRDLVRKSELLDAIHAIGISVLYAIQGPLPPFPADRLRRAFPWLLRHTSAWLADLKKFKLPRFSGLKLENYRQPGERDLEVAEAGVHLVYGANGTGKSTLVEALELVLCGSVDRLVVDGLAETIAFDSSKEARVHLRLEGLDRLEGRTLPLEGYRVPVEASMTGPLWASRPATAFRLDQNVMDLLTHPRNRGFRAKVFVDSFFPEDGLALSRHALREEEARKAFVELPADLPGFRLSKSLDQQREEVHARFAWFGSAAASVIPKGRSEDCLPLPLSDLELLANLADDLEPLLRSFKSETLSLDNLRRLTEEIDKVVSRLCVALAQPLVGALAAIKRAGAWFVVADQDVVGDFVEILNGWLEHRALADIGKKALEVARVLDAVANKGAIEKVGPLHRFRLANPQDLEDLELQVGEWMAKEEEFFDRALALETKKTGLDEGARRSAARPAFSAADAQTLDILGQVLGAPNLGTQIRQALGTGRAQTVERARGTAIEVGRFAGWSKELEQELEGLRAVAERLLGFAEIGMAEDARWRGAQRLRRFEVAFEKARQLKDESAIIEKLFFREVIENRKLANALNELLALFTPARWAYQEIELAYKASGKGTQDSEIGINAGGGRMDTRFNTAELNLFTVALFLLCAPNQPNPMRLLVLDDPLQNMDELTVTTFARGFARLLRLPTWPKEWQFLILLHGEDDLERLRQEIEAAVYRLDWQSPLDTSAKQPTLIQAEKLLSTYEAKLQHLSQVLGSG